MYGGYFEWLRPLEIYGTAEIRVRAERMSAPGASFININAAYLNRGSPLSSLNQSTMETASFDSRGCILHGSMAF